MYNQSCSDWRKFIKKVGICVLLIVALSQKNTHRLYLIAFVSTYLFSFLVRSLSWRRTLRLHPATILATSVSPNLRKPLASWPVQCVANKRTISAKTSLFAIYSQISRESASLARTVSAWTPPPSTLRSVHVWSLNAICVAGISNAKLKLYVRTHAPWQKLCRNVGKDQCEHVGNRSDFAIMSCLLNCGQMIDRYVKFHIQRR